MKIWQNGTIWYNAMHIRHPTSFIRCDENVHFILQFCTAFCDMLAPHVLLVNFIWCLCESYLMCFYDVQKCHINVTRIVTSTLDCEHRIRFKKIKTCFFRSSFNERNVVLKFLNLFVSYLIFYATLLELHAVFGLQTIIVNDQFF